ncbi:MAG: NAD(P)-binding domain-containing protein, partial [Alphaproteobacteria bacterium]|nr:NAD(P)-binding domain-containing protein [Alphaproteobacteria bacterium]
MITSERRPLHFFGSSGNSGKSVRYTLSPPSQSAAFMNRGGEGRRRRSGQVARNKPWRRGNAERRQGETAMTALKTAFIGLGVMGYPMAGHLAKAGHAVTVHNRTQAKAEAWAGEHGGAVAETPAAAVAEADFVFACVGDDDDLRDVALGAGGALAAMQQGAVFIDHTTAS